MGVGRTEVSGGFSALLCATHHVWQRWRLGAGAAVAVAAEARVSHGHVPGQPREPGSYGGQEVSPAAAVSSQCGSGHELPWGLLLHDGLQPGEKPNFYLLLI